RRQSHARSDLPQDRHAGLHEAAGLTRRRDVVSHRHRHQEQHRPEAADQDRRSREAVTPFGATADGHPVELFTLTSPTGIEIRTTSYGAILVSIFTPDRSGRIADIALGFDSLDGYLTRSRYFGAVVGRYGNRIAGGRFMLDGRTIQLATNSGANHIHGGVKGFDKVLWRGELFARGGAMGVTFSYTSPDGEEGYPGTLHTTVTYTLTRNELVADYTA